ncbi:nucleoside deaminase [Micromonospora sp. HM5-17]|jgi:tRNA(adenine34) deaminase|uniref:nucleoside deaminase n=1 Tax=Micromonospora sp. HM5-17 TaxID=2487710 RepID=UPI0026C935E9
MRRALEVSATVPAGPPGTAGEAHPARPRTTAAEPGRVVGPPDGAAAGRREMAGEEGGPRQTAARLERVAAEDVPVGAVVYGPDGTELATARNERELRGDPTAHAEILALRRAASVVGEWRLTGCTLVVTLEPCTMCAGAVVLARISTLVFGAWEPKTGAVGSLWDVVRDPRLNHRPEVYGGVLEDECAAALRAFFR